MVTKKDCNTGKVYDSILSIETSTTTTIKRLVSNLKSDMLVDTGSTLNSISLSMLEQLESVSAIRRHAWDGKAIRAANNTIIPRKVYLPTRIAGKTSVSWFVIIEDLPYNQILGTPWLTQMEAKADFKHPACLRIKGRSTPLCIQDLISQETRFRWPLLR
jgi:hypothetical protein